MTTFQKKLRGAFWLGAGLLALCLGTGGCGGKKGAPTALTEEETPVSTPEEENEQEIYTVERKETFGPGREGQQPLEAAGPVWKEEPAASMTPEPTVTAAPEPTAAATPEPTASAVPEPTASATPEPAPTDTCTPTPEAENRPEPTGTPAPEAGKEELEPSITPVDREKLREETKAATIRKPDHPDTVTNEKLIFIGDSRTEGIRDAVRSVAVDTVWSCLSGKGYDWMVTTGVPQVEGDIEKNTSVIFLMGVNDLYNINNYVNYISEKAKEWAGIGVQTYFVSVGPVESDPYCTNQQIESFNTSMENGLSGVKFIDVYHHLTENGYSTVDGVHYPANVSIEIYNYIIENLEEVRSGIWG